MVFTPRKRLENYRILDHLLQPFPWRRFRITIPGGRGGGAKTPSPLKWLLWPYFCILSNENLSRDSKDTRAESQIVTDQSWSFHGPCRVPQVDGPWPYNFLAYFGGWIPFLHCTLSRPSTHFGTLFWSLWISIRAQGTLMDPQGSLNGPQNGPYKANFRGHLVEKGPPGSHHGPNWPILLDRSQDIGQTQI